MSVYCCSEYKQYLSAKRRLLCPLPLLPYPPGLTFAITNGTRLLCGGVGTECGAGGTREPVFRNSGSRYGQCVYQTSDSITMAPSTNNYL